MVSPIKHTLLNTLTLALLLPTLQQASDAAPQSDLLADLIHWNKEHTPAAATVETMAHFIKRLEKMPPEPTHSFDTTILHEAVQTGCIELVEVILQKGYAKYVDTAKTCPSSGKYLHYKIKPLGIAIMIFKDRPALCGRLISVLCNAGAHIHHDAVFYQWRERTLSGRQIHTLTATALGLVSNTLYNIPELRGYLNLIAPPTVEELLVQHRESTTIEDYTCRCVIS